MCRSLNAPGFNRRGKIAEGFENLRDFLKRNRAFADGTAREAVAVGGPINAVVFEMQMPHQRRDFPRKRNRFFTDGKRVARVETDANIRPAFAAQIDEFGAR